MAETHDIGPFFWHTIRLRRNTAILHTSVTNEVDEPFRRANSKVIHFYPTGFGLVVGKWESTNRDEDDALLDALGIERTTGEPTLIEEGTGPAWTSRPEWNPEPITVSMINGKAVVTHAPKHSLIAHEVLAGLRRHRRDPEVVLVDKRSHYRVGSYDWHEGGYRVERVDRPRLRERLWYRPAAA